MDAVEQLHIFEYRHADGRTVRLLAEKRSQARQAIGDYGLGFEPNGSEPFLSGADYTAEVTHLPVLA